MTAGGRNIVIAGAPGKQAIPRLLDYWSAARGPALSTIPSAST
jgi:hypothetical protein